MERFLEQRERISRKLNRLIKRYEKTVTFENGLGCTSVNMSNSNTLSTNSSSNSDATSDINSKSSSGIDSDSISKAEELKEQIDIMKSNIDYLQDQIAECQTNIIQLDETRDGSDYFSLENLVLAIGSVEEAKFLVRKFLNLALNKGILAAQKEYLNNELEYELDQIEKDYNTQQQLVQQIINSGQISEELAQQILLNHSQSFSNNQNKNQINNNMNCSMNTNQNNINLINSCCNDNFEIDEIILAPMIDGKF